MRAAPAVFLLIRRMAGTSFYIPFIIHKLPCCRLQLIIISIPPSVKGFFAFRFFLCYNNPKTAAAAAARAGRFGPRWGKYEWVGGFLMRVVVKVGTSTLAHKTGCLNIRLVETLCKTLADLQNAGHQIVLVSSGAIGMGVGKLQLGARPSDMATKQAAAAVGQCELMYTYDKLFTEYNHTVAQVLLTAADIEDKMRRHNVETTLQRLLQLGAIPVINENDTVSTAEIAEVSTLGDNDTLASIVAVSVEADLLVLLSDIEGLYTADPHKNPDAVLIREVAAITPDIEALAGGAGSGQGTGGMVTKLRAARRVTQQGIPMVIANGADPLCLYDIVEGKPVGTRFLGNAQA